MHYFLKQLSSWLIFKSIEALEIKTSMLFDLNFANNSILSCFLFFFSLIIDLYVLIPGVIPQIFDPIAEFVIPKGIPSEESKAEIEIDSVTAEAKIRKCPTYCRVV